VPSDGRTLPDAAQARSAASGNVARDHRAPDRAIGRAKRTSGSSRGEAPELPFGASRRRRRLGTACCRERRPPALGWHPRRSRSARYRARKFGHRVANEGCRGTALGGCPARPLTARYRRGNRTSRRERSGVGERFEDGPECFGLRGIPGASPKWDVASRTRECRGTARRTRLSPASLMGPPVRQCDGTTFGVSVSASR
jgi:hypothetical protein